MPLHKDLREFVELLNSNKVEYVVVGGHAVAYHGYPRFTGDIDFFVDRSPENADRILKTLTAFGFEAALPSKASLMTPEKIVQLGEPPNRIDILMSISGVTFDEVVKNSVATALDSIPVRIIGKAELLRNKEAAGRPKDLADIAALEQIEK